MRASLVFHMQATELHLTVLRKLCLHVVTVTAGIKVDKGVVDLPGTDGESTTQVGSTTLKPTY